MQNDTEIVYGPVRSTRQHFNALGVLHAYRRQQEFDNSVDVYWTM